MVCRSNVVHIPEYPDNRDELRQNTVVEGFHPSPYRGGRRRDSSRAPREALRHLLFQTRIPHGCPVSQPFDPVCPHLISSRKLHKPRRVGWDWVFGLFPYGAEWRIFRRVFWQHFHAGVVSKHTPHLGKGAAMLLTRLNEDPSKLRDHIR